MNDNFKSGQIAPQTLSRQLIRSCDRAVLSTLLVEGGWPYGSLVMTACDHAAAPLLLMSDLAEHTMNIHHDSRVSLLLDGTVGLESPLTGARVTVLGTITKTEDPSLKARYIARHPESQMFAGFADFNLYKMAVERAHIVAGFGIIHWIHARELLFNTTGFTDLAASEGDIVSHMNEDHAEAVSLYATILLGLEPGEWKMTGIDPEGCDLRNEGKVARIDFEKPASDSETARAALIRLVKKARDIEKG
ncbi:MAG: DUF2470 domain-containing protein [Pseudomonadota bacterium]|nr:DUF2470 domain-containing protein [Pseudomonadota bacterium]